MMSVTVPATAPAALRPLCRAGREVMPDGQPRPPLGRADRPDTASHATTLLNWAGSLARLAARRLRVGTVTSFRHPGTVLTDRFFAVPLDHQRPDGEQIEVFAREVVAAGKADADLPWLLFLQGGPGFGAQRPVGQGVLAGPGAGGLPGAAARPARHRPVLPGEPADPGPARRQGPGRLPDPLPRRQHRAGRRADQARADRRAVERARAELRRHVRRHLPVVRAARRQGGVHHRRRCPR